jgi:cyanophycin synthetase
MTNVDLSQSIENRLERTLPPLPLVAVAGLRGKSTVVWLLDEMLHQDGRSVGLWSSNGVYIEDVRQQGELWPWGRVLSALQEGMLDVAVQELATPTVTSVGLPDNIYPLAAVTTLCGNHEDCLISPEAEQGSRATSIVARSVRPDGTLVLNGDDAGVRALAECTDARVMLFALHPENPAIRRQLAEGGRAAWVEDDWVVVGSAQSAIRVLPLSEAHFTLDGALTFQVQNLLCAVALADSLSVPAAPMRQAVQLFQPGAARLPGSCNIIQLPETTVVVDGARQVWTVRSLVRGIRHQPHRRMVTVTGCFPHLTEAQIVETGRLIGRLGGAVILHAPTNYRTLVDLMISGITQNEMLPLILSMPSEREAIAHALKMLGPSDLGLVLTADARTAINSIRSSQP